MSSTEKKYEFELIPRRVSERELRKEKVLNSIVTKKGYGYISNVIGEEYMRWSNSDLILINAPTGTGKTTFVLHELLPYAISRGRKILYLVNRKILMNQIHAELENELKYELYKEYGNQKNVNNYIDVVTYQSIEDKLKKSTEEDLEILRNNYSEYSYVVYDECHYFDVDSTYNTSTKLSYDFLTECFCFEKQIYISATMDCIRERIVMRASDIHERELIENFKWMRIFEYTVEKEYNYDIHFFNNVDHLKEIILENNQFSNSKWLIFAESIDSGKKLQSRLVDKNNDCSVTPEDVVFIDAKFEQDEDAANSVLELNKKKYINKKVVITTPVLDNGVSFQDIELRNIVITADNKEEFIQMLGRKREDQHAVKLFIQKRNKNFFENRHQSTARILKTYEKFENDFKYIYGDIYGDIDAVEPYWYSCIPKQKRRVIDQQEQKMKPLNQQNMLKNIMGNPMVYEHFTKFAFALGGFIVPNNISIDRLMRLDSYYRQIAQELAEDPDAFLRLQLSWLNITGDEAEKAIEDCKNPEFQRCVRKIKEHIEKALCNSENGDTLREVKFNAEECKAFKMGIKSECKFLLEFYGGSLTCDEKKTYIGAIMKSDRGITADQFSAIMEITKLPYSMEGNNPYVISRK